MGRLHEALRIVLLDPREADKQVGGDAEAAL